MYSNRIVIAALALTVAACTGAAAAVAADPPKATDIIFEQKHLSNIDPGKEVDYKFNRTVSNADMLGQPFSDTITLKVTGMKPTGEKDVDLQIYTGERARDLQKLPDLTINPVFLVYFNQAVNSFHQLAGGQTPYLTRVFSEAFKDKAKVEPVQIDYKGKKVDAYRITMVPFLGDKSESKMQGWENSEFVIVVSKDVPGQIVDLISKYKNKYDDKDLHVVERTTLDGASGLEETK
jgi:hypothetical protein